MAFDKTTSAGFLANHLARLFAHRLNARIADLGLAPAQFMALLELWETDGLATMANTLNRMVRDGLVTRAPHPEDRRARLVCLTDKARALEAPAKAAAAAVNKEALAALPPSERARFLGQMRALIAAMRRR